MNTYQFIDEAKQLEIIKRYSPAQKKEALKMQESRIKEGVFCAVCTPEATKEMIFLIKEEITRVYPPNLLNKWLCGSMLDIYSNCNSNFRELRYAKERKDTDSINFWNQRIELLSKVKNLLFTSFYFREKSIKTEEDFNRFMEIFKRYAQLKTGLTWYEIATGGPKKV